MALDFRYSPEDAAQEQGMKVTINIDCTPQEARAFLGLPDVRPLQESMMAEMRQRMEQTVRSMDPETMLKTWLPASLEGFEQMQKFWSQMGSATKGSDKK